MPSKKSPLHKRIGRITNLFCQVLRLTILLLTATIPVLAVEESQSIEVPKWVAATYVNERKAVGLRWMAVPWAIEYKVLRSEIKGGEYALLGTTPTIQYFDEDIIKGKTFYYIVRIPPG